MSGREERQRARQRRHPRPVAADHQRAGRRRTWRARRPRGRDRRSPGLRRRRRHWPASAAGRARAVRRGIGRHFRHRSAPALRWKSRTRRNIAVSCSAGTAATPVTQASRSVSSASSRCSYWSSSASLKPSICASAKRPMIRSASRVPRCQDRNSSRRLRGSRPSLDRVLPVMNSPTPKARRVPGAGFI